MKSDPTIGVIGAGAWGTVLAMLANRAGSKSVLWTRNEQVIESIRTTRENAQYLPDQFIDPAIEVTDDLARMSRRSRCGRWRSRYPILCRRMCR